MEAVAYIYPVIISASSIQLLNCRSKPLIQSNSINFFIGIGSNTKNKQSYLRICIVAKNTTRDYLGVKFGGIEDGLLHSLMSLYIDLAKGEHEL